ncbi:dephospho-CoA kinase [Sediminitomix flava]|uniref:Dephospho-CoA kinase n=1 Tax=Sediminitomix flava TaxID=379075 RepID=A0A315ZNL0_SEDFL|nr:dephospho-CoA kinase [Sediminitomix flava]PWJ36099.1 dephospho-CoA kinase [Sediminitomix flava]
MAKQIGITGGIGVGKSIVCRIFQNLGIPIYDADSMAKKLMVEDEVLIQGIISEFGSESYSINGELNRSYLANVVFHDAEKVKILNHLVHPRVAKHYQNWVISNNKAPYLLKEAALLFESGGAKVLDEIIVVTAPLDVRINRVLQRDPHRDKNQILAIIEKQMSEEEKIKMSDHILQNDDSSLLIPQIMKLHEYFKKS